MSIRKREKSQLIFLKPRELTLQIKYVCDNVFLDNEKYLSSFVNSIFPKKLNSSILFAFL